MEAFVILLALALIAVTVLFVRERLARMDERRQFSKERAELRAWLAERPTKAEADSQRWTACHAAYKAGWNDALTKVKAVEAAKAKALAKVNGQELDRLTMK